MGGERADDESTDTDDELQGSRSPTDGDDAELPEENAERDGSPDEGTIDGRANESTADEDVVDDVAADDEGDSALEGEDGHPVEDVDASVEGEDEEANEDVVENESDANDVVEDESDADDSGDGEGAGDRPREIEDVDGVGASRGDALRDAGYETVDDLHRAPRADLADVPGIGVALAARIKADVGVGPGSPEQVREGTDDDVESAPETESDEADDIVPETGGGGTGSDERDEPLFSGPDSDQEMPLTEHIEEMLKRLAIVIAIAGVVSLATFPFAERIINFLWYNIMPGVPGDIARPRLYGVLELLFTKLKVASLAGLIIALPAVVYQTYQFMRPGLYPHERRYYLAAIPTSLVLALVGVSFAYFVVLPAIFSYFLAYSQDVATIGFALGRTFDLILVLMGYLALVFQIPLFIMLAMMMGLVTRRGLAERRLLFWGAFLGISFLFSPDPTGMAPVIIALTMVGLFEGTLFLTKWTGRG